MIFILSILATVYSQYTCGYTNNPHQTGDNVTICVYLINNSTNASQFLAFQTKVDEYSAVKLNNSYSYIHSESCPTSNSALNISYTNCSMTYSIVVASENNISTVEAPYIGQMLVAPVYSVVITLDNGKVTLIQWDNDWNFCNAQCLTSQQESVCANAECSETSAGDCDPRVYISWLGTDSQGNNLISASYRMSQFQKYSINSLYSQAKTKF